MKRTQRAMTRAVAQEDEKRGMNERDRLETAEACERKESEWGGENTPNNIDSLVGGRLRTVWALN